jgi:hypothetical protein
MRKQLRKYVAASLHHFGMNKHAFWTGQEWSSEEDDSVFFNHSDDAAKVSKDNNGGGDYVSVRVEF